MPRSNSTIASLALMVPFLALSGVSKADLSVSFDPGPLNTTFMGRWASPRFDLDEPLSQVLFEFSGDKLINLSANANQSYLFEFNTHNHGLSQNYQVTKTIAFLDSAGEEITRSRYSSVVNTQEGLAFFRSTEPILGIAAIEVTYDPAVPEVGPNAKVSLAFNQRTASGTLSVLADLPGDLNYDGSVDVADYTTWRDNLDESASAMGYIEWRDALAASPAAQLSVAVPEPSAIVPICITLACLFIRRRNRQSYPT